MTPIEELEQELREEQRHAFDGICAHCLAGLSDPTKPLCKQCQEEYDTYLNEQLIRDNQEEFKKNK